MLKRYAALPEPFCYYRVILNSDHLHFGLWPEDNPAMSMEDAQSNMFNLLLSFFPPAPADVLDVGCGLGLSASLLVQKGYRVTAISPSPEMIQYARLTYGGSGVKFREVGFLDEDEDVFGREQYDIVLFQESAQYISPLGRLVGKAREILKDNGYLVIGDEVCYDGSIKSETSVHFSKDFTIVLAEKGFRITENRKVGKEVFPTYDFVIRGFTKERERIMAECQGTSEGSGLGFYRDGWKRQKTWNEQGKAGYEIFVARKDPFSVVPYSADDESRILSAFNEVFGVNRTLSHWYWKFRDNPYGAYKISEVLSKEGGIVAHYAGYPVPVYCDADGTPATFLSFQIGDTMTRPEVRRVGRGKTSLLARSAQHFYARYCAGTVPFTYGFNTGAIKKFGERFLGYQYIDPIPYRVRNVAHSPLKRPSLLKNIFSGYAVMMIDSFDDTFDRLFEKTAPSYRFLVRRESRYLTWRYRDCPDREYISVSVHSRGKLAGWSVFLRKDTRLIWGDALFDRGQPGAVGFLLDSVLRMSRCRGVETVEGWFSKNPAWWNKILDGLGFEVTQEPDDLFPGFFVLSDRGWLEKLQEHFYYTMGDSDLF